MNISSFWVAESTLLLCRPPTKAATMAEIPAAMLLTSRTGRRTALFTVPKTFSICLTVGLHGVIDLLQTGIGAVACVVEKVRPRARPVRARNGRRRRFGSEGR